MKKLYVCLYVCLLLLSCDDGKIEVASFDFDSTNLKSCNEGIANSFFLYAIKDKRAIIIKIKEVNLENQLSPVIAPLVIDGLNQVTYREYAGNIANDNICGFPTNVSVPLEKEWKGVGGFIKIETTIAKSDPSATGATNYDSYNHKITLVNPSFENGVGGQQKADFIFLGAYNKPNLNRFADFTPNLILKKCVAGNNFYKLNNNQSLVLNVDNNIFRTNILDAPKTITIDGINNKFLFRVHNATQLDASFCGTVPPVTSIIDSWNARNGGIIEVVTSSVSGSVPPQFTHRVRLINVELVKGDLFFNLGSSYLLGSFLQ